MCGSFSYPSVPRENVPNISKLYSCISIYTNSSEISLAINYISTHDMQLYDTL